MSHRYDKSKGAFFLAAIAGFVTALQIYSAGLKSDYRYDWDMLAYVGLALRIGGATSEQAHRLTFEQARVHVPAAEYYKLVVGPPNKRLIARSPEEFGRHLPFYDIKPAYPALIALLAAAGVNPIDATGFVSMAAFAGLAAVLLRWLCAFMAAPLALSLTAAIATNPLFLSQSYHPSPDALSAMFIITAFALGTSRAFPAAAAVAVASVAVRPDDILLLGATVAMMAILGQWRIALVGGIAGVALFFAILHEGGAYPWSTLFYTSFVERVPDPDVFVSPLTVGGYLEVYRRNALLMPEINPSLPFMATLAILTVIMRVRRAGWRDPYSLVAIGATLAISAHWAVFPIGMPRHLFGYYIVILVTLAKNLTDAFQTRNVRSLLPLA